jgi:hypothetical protein
MLFHVVIVQTTSRGKFLDKLIFAQLEKIKEFCHILLNSEVHYSVHKIPPTDHVLSYKS